MDKFPHTYNVNDIHNYGKRLRWALEKIKAEQRISEEDRSLLLEYLSKLESKDLNAGRVTKYATTLLSIRLHMNVNFKEAKTKDVEDVVRWINESDFQPWTKYDYKGILKRFYRWLRTGALDSGQPFPPEVAWIKTNLKRNEMKEPDVLTEDEARAMIDKASKLRDKAFIAVLYEGVLE